MDVKDTVGCGDSFAAAIVLGYTRGVPVATTLALANAVGAATAMGCGAGRNVASSTSVLKILSEPRFLEGASDLLPAHKNASELLQKVLEEKAQL